MDRLAPIVILLLTVTVIVLVLGIISMMRGGEVDEENSTRLMFQRVEFQVAVVAVLLIAGFSAGLSTGFLWGEDEPSQPWRIELGVVSAEAFEAAYDGTGPGATALGDAPEGSDAYLITAIVIDPETGERIDDARVWATPTRVSGAEAQAPQKQLEAVTIAGNVTYGGYFRLPGNEPYSIDVRVEHASAEPQRARLEFHPSS